MNAPGRNDPCPCGSGEKYKKCCLDKEKQVATSSPAMTEDEAIDLALQHQQAGRLQEAAALYRQVIEHNPRCPDALNLLGSITYQTGNYQAALELINRAIEAAPHIPMYYSNAGPVLIALGLNDEALASYRKAVELQPDYVEARNNIAHLLKEKGNHEEAVAQYLEAIRIRPDYASAHFNLGNTLRDMGRLDEALSSYLNTLKYQPSFAAAYVNAGVVLTKQGRFNDALQYYQQALLLQPGDVDTYLNMANALSMLGRAGEAIAACRSALQVDPSHADAYSSLLITMLYSPDVTSAQIHAENVGFAKVFEVPFRATWPRHENPKTSDRRLKIGYVSGDFRHHPVAYFIEAILANHDKSNFEIYCYHNHPAHDQVTDRLAKYADHWLQIQTMNDEQVAARIQADGIDILVDLSGHTAFNRLPVFARKPAPVQVTVIGYPGSTGLEAMDYRLTDEFLDPEGMTEQFHTEKLMRLSASAIFQPDSSAPEVNKLPALSAGEFTFASLSTPTKLNEQVIALWARILKAVSPSRLMLGNAQPGQVQWLLDLFARHGIGPERLLLQPRMGMREYLALHGKIDLGLDPFPYNGGTTTFHALWMGVPVITLAGDKTVSRSGASIMGSLGLKQLLVHSEEEYLELAVRMAGNLKELSELRHGLRDVVASKCTGDPVRYTRALEAAYRTIWQDWCAKGN